MHPLLNNTLHMVFTVLLGFTVASAAYALGMTESFALATGLFAVGAFLAVSNGQSLW
jgi:hypothetical protein